MTVLTLLVKAQGSRQLKLVQDLLNAELEDLDLDFKVLGAPVNKWVQVSVSGEDEVLAVNYIIKKIGICPVSIKKIEKFSLLKGYITKLDQAKKELAVDVGIFEPKIVTAVVPLTDLQAQFADCTKADLKQISEAYGLQEDLPLHVRVVNLVSEGQGWRLQAELSNVQIEKISLWQDSLLDRLIVLGTEMGDVEKVLKRTRLNRDIIEVERLGLFENSLTCKFGTDAAGLIPRIGRYMRNAVFVVISPRKMRGLSGEKPLAL